MAQLLKRSINMNQQTVIIGIIAGILTGASLVPQLIKIIKEKKAEGISYGMLAVLLAGLAGWIWYGILKKDKPLLFTNSFSFLINIVTAFFTIKYRKK
jgi:MtN3 and saliva related transmembrane protein